MNKCSINRFIAKLNNIVYDKRKEELGMKICARVLILSYRIGLFNVIDFKGTAEDALNILTTTECKELDNGDTKIVIAANEFISRYGNIKFHYITIGILDDAIQELEEYYDSKNINITHN